MSRPSTPPARLRDPWSGAEPPEQDGHDTSYRYGHAPSHDVTGPDEWEEKDGDVESESNMQLTELAVPVPVRREDPRLPSLEEAERRARRKGSRDEELGELAAPEPLQSQPDEEEARVSLSRRSSQDRRLSTTSHERKGLQPTALAGEVITVSWLIFFSLWGTLARLGVEALTLYPNTPFTSRVLWANLGGSFVMGFLTEDRRLFREEWGFPDPKETASAHGRIKKTIPLYIGLATGFCGSFTSFSSYMQDCFLALTNALEGPSPTAPYHTDPSIAPRNGGYSFMALLAIMLVHPSVSLSALHAGAQLAYALQPVTPTIPVRFIRRVLDPLVVLIGPGCWLGAVFLAIWPPGDATHWRYRAVMPLVFAPPGCLLRFYVSKHINATIPAFPLGTFTVNIFGTVILGMAYDLQHAGNIGASSPNACTVLEGIMQGFCGCLTTVSTWVAEINGLRRTHGWFYGSTSVAVGLAMLVVIMGSMGWTVGFQPPACS